MHGANLLLEAKRWLQQALPHWNRTGGRDHVWLVTHDEGSCWVPSELRSSIILSHWGRKVGSPVPVHATLGRAAPQGMTWPSLAGEAPSPPGSLSC